MSATAVTDGHATVPEGKWREEGLMINDRITPILGIRIGDGPVPEESCWWVGGRQ